MNGPALQSGGSSVIADSHRGVWEPEEIFDAAQEEYTKGLLDAIPY